MFFKRCYNGFNIKGKRIMSFAGKVRHVCVELNLSQEDLREKVELVLQQSIEGKTRLQFKPFRKNVFENFCINRNLNFEAQS